MYSILRSHSIKHSLLHSHDMATWNGHRDVHNIYTLNIGISKHEKHDFLVQIRNYLLPLSLKALRHKETDTLSFYSGFFIWHPHLVRHLPKASASKRKSTLLLRCPVLNSINFLQNSQNTPRASGAWLHSHLLSPFPIWAIVTSLSDTSAPPARAWTPALMLHLSNPCTKPKGSLPN